MPVSFLANDSDTWPGRTVKEAVAAVKCKSAPDVRSILTGDDDLSIWSAGDNHSISGPVDDASISDVADGIDVLDRTKSPILSTDALLLWEREPPCMDPIIMGLSGFWKICIERDFGFGHPDFCVPWFRGRFVGEQVSVRSVTESWKYQVPRILTVHKWNNGYIFFTFERRTNCIERCEFGRGIVTKACLDQMYILE